MLILLLKLRAMMWAMASADADFKNNLIWGKNVSYFVDFVA